MMSNNFRLFKTSYSLPGWKNLQLCSYMSRNMTKQIKWHVRPAKTQISLGNCPVWSVFIMDAQADQSLPCPHGETLGPKLHIEHIAKTLIRMRGCKGWSESLLGRTCHFVGFVILWLTLSFISHTGRLSLQRKIHHFPNRLNWPNTLKTASSIAKCAPLIMILWPLTCHSVREIKGLS